MLITAAEPILNPVWVLIVTGEKPSVTALAGGALIILAVISSTLIGMHREESSKRLI
jgi:drug/metabolite transporter (DMT)-like permease